RTVWAGYVLGVLAIYSALPGTWAQTQTGVAAPAKLVPAIVENDGRYALLVDGAPYLMLGVQARNSSAWPEYLGRVWPAAEALHANTVELPIYWEQIEVTPGKFDFSL